MDASIRSIDSIRRQLKELHDIQANCLDSDYMRGLYNGLELALSVVEGTAPQFIGRETKGSPRPNLYDVRHSDEVALVRFAMSMRDKLAESRTRGRHGWETTTGEHLSELLRQHVEKGDPLDVANFCMFLHQRGDRIFPA